MEWLAEHRGIIVKVARSFGSNSADLAELEQEMIVQIWSSLSAYAGQAKPSTWICRVCLNTALMWRRSSTRRSNKIEPDADLSLFVVDSASPVEAAQDRDLVDRLYAAIQTLAEFDRALVLPMLDGLSHREIAQVTGLSENHVGVALLRARRRLAEKFKGAIDEME